MNSRNGKRQALLFLQCTAVACALLAGCSERREAPPLAVAAAAPAQARAPVTLPVCGQPASYTAVPRRAVAHGINIVEMMLALGLEDRLAGYGGLRDVQRLPPAMRAQLAGVPDLSSTGMNLETILGAQADFVFSGWSYGFRDGQVTPQGLAELGIASYVLTESCIRKVARQRVALEDTFADLLALGRIFGTEARAQALVDGQRAELRRIGEALQGVARPRVFVYDSGTDIPVTTGRYAMPQAMIEAAGGSNIFADLDSSWMRGNWEDVIARDPDWIVIVDNDRPAPGGKQAFLLGKPELAQVRAIRERRFVLLDFAEATPGPRNLAGVQRIARALHPDRLPTP
ncbi:MAG: ABC transporter substrate-binding protein [Comamonas sp.]